MTGMLVIGLWCAPVGPPEGAIYIDYTVHFQERLHQYRDGRWVLVRNIPASTSPPNPNYPEPPHDVVRHESDLTRKADQ